MSVWDAIVLGLLQGLCEFLPVSSSGHLVLAARVLGVSSPGIFLEVMLHLGTLAAVGIVYWKDLLSMLKNPLGKDVRLLVIATLPAVAAALLLGDYLEELFSGALLGLGFLLTTAVLFLGGTFQGRRAELTYRDAGIMGLFQAVAILPGLSRSGSTISGGQMSGLGRDSAARFAFLMSVPAILGSLVLEVKNLATQGMPAELNLVPVLIGVLVAAASGLVAIRFMLRLLRKTSLRWFGVYTLVLGVLVLVDQYVTHFFF